MPPPASASDSPAWSPGSGSVDAVARRAAHLDEVQAGRQLGREVDDDRLPARRRGVDRGRDRRRRVDDDEVALVQPRRQVAGRARPRRLVADRHHHPHGVAPAERQLRRLCRLQLRRQHEVVEVDGRGVDDRASRPRRDEARRRRRRGSGRSARRCRSRARIAGTLCSGGGRSEMSSPGKASWCICVRMSPGSIDEHPEVRPFDGEHAPDVVERGLRGAVAAPARVRLDRRVRRDVDDRRRRRRGDGSAAWIRPSGATTLTSNSDAERVERVVGDGGQRRRAEPAGVVDDEVDRAGRGDEVGAVGGGRDVAGIAVTPARPSTAPAQGGAVATVGHDAPARLALSSRTRARPRPRDPPVTMAVRCSTMAPLEDGSTVARFNSDHCF